MRFDVLTTFPQMFSDAQGAALNSSIPARARAADIAEWHAHDIRAFTQDKHQKTDDRPFGGGPGMVMLCQPLYDAVLHVESLDPRPATRVLLTPQGRPLTQPLVEDLAARPRLLLIAGHYEGIDERVVEALAPIEISLGDYVLSGGELAAMVLMDAVIRLLPNVLGDEASNQQDSFTSTPLAHHKPSKRAMRELSDPAAIEDWLATPPSVRLLDCPHYSKPREWMGRAVPEVLFSGDHQKIERWRLRERLARTRDRRPDLFDPALRTLLAQLDAEFGES